MDKYLLSSLSDVLESRTCRWNSLYETAIFSLLKIILKIKIINSSKKDSILWEFGWRKKWHIAVSYGLWPLWRYAGPPAGNLPVRIRWPTSRRRFLSSLQHSPKWRPLLFAIRVIGNMEDAWKRFERRRNHVSCSCCCWPLRTEPPVPLCTAPPLHVPRHILSDWHSVRNCLLDWLFLSTSCLWVWVSNYDAAFFEGSSCDLLNASCLDYQFWFCLHISVYYFRYGKDRLFSV